VQHVIKDAIEIGTVAVPATIAAGIYPSIGEYPLFILAEHAVTPDFIVRIIALAATAAILGFTIHNHLSES